MDGKQPTPTTPSAFRATLSLTAHPRARKRSRIRPHRPAIARSRMNRQLALRVVIVLVGILFVALTYPMLVFVRQDPALSMMFSLYVDRKSTRLNSSHLGISYAVF